ncbi:Hypothetical protein, putative [Bodo saltans]|uniref:Uncharacterized protein n=1 Tax=Bodo saltans TaxID=75058 RepID=A0A0S4JHZ2_BODSA|nr:Hypothetical protein, putative [Bodo saltans]|eukprot:CUG88861.1 Hypothetical protein, putative [Bodo saltans]
MGASCSASAHSASGADATASHHPKSTKTLHYREKSTSSTRQRKGTNPFHGNATKGRSLRRLRHKILIQRLYEDRAPSEALVKKLNLMLAGKDDSNPVKNPLGDELHDSVGPFGEGCVLSFEVSVAPEDQGPSSDNGAEAGGTTPPKVSSSIPKQRSRGHLSPQYQAYIDAGRDLRNLLQMEADTDTVTFVLAPQNDAQGSVHGQLSAQGGSRSNSGLNAAAILQQRSTLNSILIHNGRLKPSDAESPGTPSLGLNVCRRTLHVSPKCVGYLTNEIHMKILRGASDTARILEDIKFVRVADE